MGLSGEAVEGPSNCQGTIVGGDDDGKAGQFLPLFQGNLPDLVHRLLIARTLELRSMTFSEIIQKLTEFWIEQGCAAHLGHDVETGAGTFNPATFFRCLGPEPYRAAYVELSRRPSDGRYGENPNRMQLFHQYQVILKPSPPNAQDLYLESLEAIGFDLSKHDIRFVHDDWEQPTLGAWGLGWEVWRDGMEVTQFTYFQQVGGVELDPITVELTYGLERIAMAIQGVDSVWDLQWSDTLTYRDIAHRSEWEWSTYNFEASDPEMWHRAFADAEKEAKRLVEAKLPIVAYDFVMKASHAFNMLDARGVVSVADRTGYIQRIRELARAVAEGYIEGRAEQGHPLMRHIWPSHRRPEVKVPEPVSDFEADKREDFVLEIGSEELPATFVPIGCENLKRDLTKLLNELELPYESIEIYGTPRRLTAMVKGLAKGKKATKVEKRGPPLDRVTDGFRKSIGDAHLEERDGYLWVTRETPALSTNQLLAERLPNLILKLDFPKQMRWSDLAISYARPLHWVVALHGSEVIPFVVGDIASGNESSAHRQLCPGTFTIKKAADYLNALREHKVMADIEERKNAILDQLEGEPLALEQVLPQVLNLTEWPQLTTASFDPAFLKIPQEVLISEMVHHQKYFPLGDGEGKLTNEFVITADNNPSDEIRQGNVKVLSARLADGAFLFQQDLKRPLEAYNEKLKGIGFHNGTMHDKVERLKTLSAKLLEQLPIADATILQRAAHLCKADLATELVGEFPDLQGIIGSHYALIQKEDPLVAQAIREHWMPRGDKAPLPSSHAGILLALADRIDNLNTCFELGLKPKSSSDPYGLRRQVLAIIHMLIGGKYRLNLGTLLRDDVLEFFANRIRTVFTHYGLASDETDAALQSGFNDIYDAYLRVQALHEFRKTEAFGALFEVFKRAGGLIDAKKQYAFDEKKLVEPQEKALYKILRDQKAPFAKAIESEDYPRAYALLSELKEPLADFFDHVHVMSGNETEENRLALLKELFSRFDRLLDFGSLQR